MTWQLAILLHQVLETVFALTYRNYAKTHPRDYFVTNAVMYACTVVPFGIFWSLSHGGLSLNFSSDIWWFFIIAGLLFALGNVASYKANTKVEASQFSIITSFRVVVVVVVSWFLLREQLTAKQLIGAFIVFCTGLFIISLRKRAKNFKQVNYYSLIAVASTLLMGLAIVTEKYILNSVTIATYLFIGWGLQLIFMLILANRQLLRVPRLFANGDIKIIVVMGLLRTFAGFCFINALQLSDNVSLIASIAALQIVLVTVCAYVFLNERKYGVQKFIAASVAFFGVILLVA